MNPSNYKHVIIAGAVIFVLLTGIVFFLTSRKEVPPESKPRIAEPKVEPKKEPTEEKWFIRFSVKNQMSTAYTEEAYAPLAASGGEYFIGGIAVHPRYPGIDPRIPLIPFGTEIYLTKPVTIHGKQYSSLKVIDTGDIYYGLWGAYPYWFDIYFGQMTYYNNKAARDYGTSLADYYWYEEWK